MTEQKGVGPHPEPWPTDEYYDPELLASGDSRNVADEYRYWKVDAIVADLDKKGSNLEIAIENLERDFNMGTIVRSANAFGVRRIHVIGRKQWNKRGAMVSDTYLHVMYHSTVDAFIKDAKADNRTIVAMDIVEGAKDLLEYEMPDKVVLVFGSEGAGISQDLQQKSDAIIKIEQTGSTRSINVGVAAGIAMYAWIQKHGKRLHK
jgi:tRNA G18 (ribose-2'-O)-methylase SpoU